MNGTVAAALRAAVEPGILPGGKSVGFWKTYPLNGALATAWERRHPAGEMLPR
jgi:hypothetical protein